MIVSSALSRSPPKKRAPRATLPLDLVGTSAELNPSSPTWRLHKQPRQFTSSRRCGSILELSWQGYDADRSLNYKGRERCAVARRDHDGAVSSPTSRGTLATWSFSTHAFLVASGEARTFDVTIVLGVGSLPQSINPCEHGSGRGR